MSYTDNPYRHFYLYAKNWYRRNSLYDDLRTLMTDCYAIPREGINTGDILETLLSLAYAEIQQSGDSEHQFVEMFFDLHPDGVWRILPNDVDSEGLTYIDRVIWACLSIMRTSEVDDLGDPDASLLPPAVTPAGA